MENFCEYYFVASINFLSAVYITVITTPGNP